MATEIIQSLLRELRHAGTDDLFTECTLHESELAVCTALLRGAAPAGVLLVEPDFGTLAIVALFGLRVCVVGVDPVRAAQLERRLPSVRFFNGEHGAAVRAASDLLAAEKRELDFAIVARRNAAAALPAVLSLPLQRSRTVLLHGSSDPAVRSILTATDWAAWKSIHEVELDFIVGNPAGGGFARVKQRPDARAGELAIERRAQALFERTAAASSALDQVSLYRKFAELDEAALQTRLAGGAAAQAVDDPAFLGIRARLLPRLAAWRSQGKRVAVYGAGKHTQALLGLVPELYPSIEIFLDRNRTAPFLGRPCVAPATFTKGRADVIVYSSRAAEKEMAAGMQAHAVEHVLLYAENTSSPAAATAPVTPVATDSPFGAKLAQAQAQISDLQLSVAALMQQQGRSPEPQDLHFSVVHEHLQLGVRYAISCAVPGEIAEFGTMAGRTASVIAAAMKAYDRFTPQERKALYLFDSFRGLPAASSEIDRTSPHVASGVWGEGTCLGITEEALVEKCAAHLDRARIRTFAGWFSDTLPQLSAETRFALLHIDCDLYQSTWDVLSQCFSRGLVSPGAAVFFDDWNCNAARPELGERRAWAEAVALYRIEYSDCGEYGMGCRKFVIHSYSPTTPTAGVRVASEPRRLSVAG